MPVIDFERYELAYIDLAVRIQINEIKLEILKGNACENSHRQLDILEGISNKICQAKVWIPKSGD